MVRALGCDTGCPHGLKCWGPEEFGTWDFSRFRDICLCIMRHLGDESQISAQNSVMLHLHITQRLIKKFLGNVYYEIPCVNFKHCMYQSEYVTIPSPITLWGSLQWPSTGHPTLMSSPVHPHCDRRLSRDTRCGITLVALCPWSQSLWSWASGLGTLCLCSLGQSWHPGRVSGRPACPPCGVQ